MKSKKCYSLAMAIITCANLSLLASSARAQSSGPEPVRITGQVMDERNNPINGIEIKAFMGVERVAKDKTKNGGRYTLRFNPGDLVSVVLYTGLEYCPGSIYNVSGRTAHNITKVIYKRNANAPCKNDEEAKASLAYIQAYPELFREELEMYAGLLDVTPKGGDNSRGDQKAAQRPYRAGDREVDAIIRRVEQNADRFRASIDAALDRSRYDNTRAENNINGFVRDFESSTDRLRSRFNSRQSVDDDVLSVLNAAASIDTFMRNNRLTNRAQTDWTNVRTDLTALADAYAVAWNWTNYQTETQPAMGTTAGLNRLTGTYRLDTSRSDNARDVVERATRELPAADRQRVHDRLLARLEAPEQLAIDRRGRTVQIASTRAPQTTFEADGAERAEQLPNGRTTRVTTDLVGDRLEVRSTGSRDSDFTVTFDPIEQGRRLRVTRRLYSERLTQPVVVVNHYDKVSDVAQFDIYYGSGGNYQSTASTGDFLLRDGETVVATLESELSTKTVKPGQRVTLVVRQPSQYEGAMIEGTVASSDRGGRVTGRSEMSFDFDTIRLRDGRSYRFAGFVEAVRAAGGEVVKVNNEGTVRENDQTNKTVQRTAIGTAVGAIIGAMAGGGKGAAIGAVIGAAGGAGSVYVQGRDDVELPAGTEFTLRSSAPRNR